MNKSDAFKRNKVVRNQTLFQFKEDHYPNENNWEKIYGFLYTKEEDFKVFEIPTDRTSCSDSEQTQSKKITFDNSFVKLTLIKEGMTYSRDLKVGVSHASA
ncbi:MAG: hypothetical protein KKF46_04340 [Nanoarchaeota archaeon]|nr:hypothetical protein [Nanoarchaeota archaeon]